MGKKKNLFLMTNQGDLVIEIPESEGTLSMLIITT
jgi:hypothetical protein